MTLKSVLNAFSLENLVLMTAFVSVEWHRTQPEDEDKVVKN